jgi:hypothetical protein
MEITLVGSLSTNNFKTFSKASFVFFLWMKHYRLKYEGYYSKIQIFKKDWTITCGGRHGYWKTNWKR